MMGIQNYISVSTFSLAIALTVFVAITVILLVLLIALGASKSFRTVFFREKQKRPKKKKTEKAAYSEPSEYSEPQAAEQPKSARSTAARKRAGAEPEYLNAIPTVPLGRIPQATPAPTGRRSSARMRTEFEAVEEQPRATYTARSVTITRARSSSVKSSDDEANNTEPKGRSAKKR